MFGLDPELFIFNEQGKPVSAHNVLPHKSKGIYAGCGCWLYRDGFAAELSVPITNCRGYLVNYLRAGIQSLQRLLPAGHYLSTAPCVRIDRRTMKSAPNDAREFGCEPSRNAYQEGMEGIVNMSERHKWRYAGFHMHFSHIPFTEKNIQTAIRAVKLMDRYIGIPMSIILPSKEAAMRRKYYGKAGEFRLQKYPNQYSGLEYRVLGADAMNHQALISLCCGLGREIVRSAGGAACPVKYDAGMDEDVQGAINSLDEKECWKLFAEYPDWYNEKMIRLLRDKSLREFDFPSGKEGHEGINEHVRLWGMQEWTKTVR